MHNGLTITRAKGDQGVVITKRLACDTLTPVGAYLSLVGERPGFLLESLPGTYSFLGRFAHDSVIRLDGDAPDPWSQLPRHSLEFIQGELPPFIGGYIGYIGYDMARGIERLPRPAVASGFPDALLGRVDTFLVFDHRGQEIALMHTIPEPGVSDEAALIRSRAEFSVVEDGLYSRAARPPDIPSACTVQDVSISEQGFMDAVLKAKQYILEGEIIQTVLSRRLTLDATCDTFDTFRRLRRINPSPYMFYIKLDDVTLIGSSPEVMVKVKGGAITTLPIAGTRPRGATPQADKDLAHELLADEKERAEHLMLLDLARNDVGRVALPGTVQVAYRDKVKFYSHVMHIVSCVKGVRPPDVHAVDLLTACVPAGTVSGAPKVRAMEIIDELEGRCRGPYAGAVGYFSYSGNIDTGIGIRTIFVKGRTYHVQAGAGIVWDSVPEGELKEIDNKLRALSTAMGGMA